MARPWIEIFQDIELMLKEQNIKPPYTVRVTSYQLEGIKEELKSLCVYDTRHKFGIVKLGDFYIEVPNNCPQCDSQYGVKEPRVGGMYCEDCGWPDDDFGEA